MFCPLVWLSSQLWSQASRTFPKGPSPMDSPGASAHRCHYQHTLSQATLALSMRIGPLAVEPLSCRLVHALKCMRTEEIALRLHEIRGKLLATVLIKICERRGHGRARDAAREAERHDPAPGRLPTHDFLHIREPCTAPNVVIRSHMEESRVHT